MGTHPIFESDFDCLTDFRMESLESESDKLPEFEPEDEIPDWSPESVISDELRIERLKRELKAEMKKGKDETEDKVYSWVGKQMKIRITDNRILVGKFLCTDKDQNIILQNTEEFLNEVGESGRLVGMVMVPGEHIKSIHIQKVRPGHLPKLIPLPTEQSAPLADTFEGLEITGKSVTSGQISNLEAHYENQTNLSL